MTLLNISLLQQQSVYADIQIFLRSKTQNTASEYEADIRQFFSIHKDKALEALTPEDIRIKLADVLRYQTFLHKEFRDGKGQKYKNVTINRKINAIKSLYAFFKANEYDVNSFIFKEVKDLPNDTHHIGNLSPDEAWMLADLALQEKHDAKQKRAIILMAASTSLRKEAIRTIRYCDIFKSNDDDNKYIVDAPDLFDKGKKIKKELHAYLYNLFLEFRGDRKDEDKIFTLSSSAIQEMMTRLCNKAGFDPKRNISFHSLKKAGVELAHILSEGDMFVVTAQGGWSSPTTPYNSYLRPQANIAGMAMFEGTFDDSVYDELTREELIQLLKGAKSAAGIQLRRDAKKIIDVRS